MSMTAPVVQQERGKDRRRHPCAADLPPRRCCAATPSCTTFQQMNKEHFECMTWNNISVSCVMGEANPICTACILMLGPQKSHGNYYN